MKLACLNFYYSLFWFMGKHQDLQEYLKKLGREFEEDKKRDIEKARHIAESVIPYIREDLGDTSLEITVGNHGSAGVVTGPNSFSINYSRFLSNIFEKADYDSILGLAQHEKLELEKEFPDVIMREVMVDMAAADKYGPYALFSYQIKNVLDGDFTSPWIYALGSLVNLKPLLSHESQKRAVEKALKTNYPSMLCDMLNYINFKVPEGKKYASRKLGNLSITSPLQREMEDLFSEFIQGLSIERRYIETAVNNPFSPVLEFPKEFITDYKKLEDTLVIKNKWLQFLSKYRSFINLSQSMLHPLRNLMQSYLIQH